MGFALFGIEIIPATEIYGIWFLSFNHWNSGWKRPMIGIHYDMGTIIIHFMFMQFEIGE